MRLNGLHGEVGTVLHLEVRTSGRFVAIDAVDDHGVILRYATAEDMSNMQKGSPRSYSEYRALPKVSSPYGLIRVENRPRPHPVAVKTPVVGPQTIVEHHYPNRRMRRRMGWD